MPAASPESRRKRRKVQLALAASVFTLILLIGGGLWWNARSRQANDVALDQAEAALRKDGLALYAKRDFDGAIAAFWAAIRINPQDAGNHARLGTALYAKKDYNGAVAAFRAAIRLDSQDAGNHVNLGIALYAMLDLDGAVAAFKEAIWLDPRFAAAYSNLGTALYAKMDLDGAIAAYKEAIRLNPKFALAYTNLGNALRDKNDVNGALAACKEAIRLDPKLALAHFNLGLLLRAKKDVDGAVAAYKNAIRVDRQFVAPYVNLSEILAERDEPAAALQLLCEGAKVKPGWFELENVDHDYGGFQCMQHYGGFQCADDLSAVIRYCLACYAARAGTGQGKDAPPESERPLLRNMSLSWLVADLAARRQKLNGANSKLIANQIMTHWLGKADFAGVRDGDKLKNLPADERKRWEQLWADVRKLRDETAPELLPSPREAKKDCP